MGFLEKIDVVELKRFLLSVPFNSECGYGNQIYIKEFKVPWGKAGSIRETTQMLLFPLI